MEPLSGVPAYPRLLKLKASMSTLSCSSSCRWASHATSLGLFEHPIIGGQVLRMIQCTAPKELSLHPFLLETRLNLLLHGDLLVRDLLVGVGVGSRPVLEGRRLEERIEPKANDTKAELARRLGGAMGLGFYASTMQHSETMTSCCCCLGSCWGVGLCKRC